jgi:hypothetical protein
MPGGVAGASQCGRMCQKAAPAAPATLVATGIAMCAAFATAGAGDAPAARGADPRVAAMLAAAQLGHTVDADGDFRILYALQDGRTQLAWIASETAIVAGLELRELWSVALWGRGEPAPALLARLLEDNAARRVGAWQLQRSGDEYLVVLSAPMPAAADAATLLPQLEAVAVGADAMEQALDGRDGF